MVKVAKVKVSWVSTLQRDRPVCGKSVGVKSEVTVEVELGDVNLLTGTNSWLKAKGEDSWVKGKGEDVNLQQRQTHSFDFAPPACQWVLIKTWEEQPSDLLRHS